MKAKLIKKDNQYYCLDKDTIIIGTTDESLLEVKSFSTKKLSLKNCQAIERGYDLDELAESEYLRHESNDLLYGDSEDKQLAYKAGIVDGFQKALEILGDKKSAVKDFLDTWFDVDDTLIGDPVWVDSQGLQVITPKQLNDLYQQNEWEVEIIKKNSRTGKIIKSESDLEWDENGLCDSAVPVFDADGCLILKRVT